MEQKAQRNDLQMQLKTLLEAETPQPELQEVCAQSDPHILAETLREFPVSDILVLMGKIHIPIAAQALTYFDTSFQNVLLGELSLETLAKMIGEIEPDDAAELVDMLDEETGASLLELLTPEIRSPIENLLGYEEDTAGRLMDPDVVTVEQHKTVSQAIEEIRGYVEQVRLDRFYSIFVVSKHNHLMGTVPVWKMLLAESSTQISDLMEPVVSSVEADLDQEDLAKIVRDHDLVVVPVVDDQNRLVGRVTVDDVVDIIQEEHEEDLGRLTGTGAEEVRELSIFQTIRLRAPWLMVALVGEFALAAAMQGHEDFFALLPQLAFFIPLIMAMGGNTGVQSASLVIRGLGTGEVKLGHFWSRLGREVLVAIITGCLFGSILIIGSGLITGQSRLGLAVGLATLAGIILAAALGTTIPMILKRMKFDPALATGPFITTLNDILGILLYLGIAYALLVR